MLVFIWQIEMRRRDLLRNFTVIVLKCWNVFLGPPSLDLVFQGGELAPEWLAGIRGWPILKADINRMVSRMKTQTMGLTFPSHTLKKKNFYLKGAFIFNFFKSMLS